MSKSQYCLEAGRMVGCTVYHGGIYACGHL